MKKRTVKDFVALYAPEDEEKLVLIQDGISADKTFLDTFWAAHTHALAMADVQTGEVISGRCYLSWPLTDKERDAGDYSKRFAKGQIYRIKAHGWKGDALYEPQWYVTEVLEEGVPCPALEEIWAEYTKPILLEDEVLGTLTLDREMSIFEGTCKWMGKEVRISLDVEIEKKASWTRVTNVMKKLVADQETWDKSLRVMAAQKLTAQANEWLADNDQTDRAPEKDPITEDEFARCIEAIEAIPEQERDYLLTVKLSRAYSNLAVLGDHGEHGTDSEVDGNLIQHAIRLLESVRTQGENDPYWNSRMGYSCLMAYSSAAIAYEYAKRWLSLAPDDPAAQKLVRDCEEYLEEEKALEIDLKEREEFIRRETPDDKKGVICK